MAFVCTVNEIFDAHIVRRGESVAVAASVGHDDVEAINYSVLVGFEPAPGEIEFFFCLISENEDDNEERTYRDGKDVQRFTCKEDRIKILGVILKMVEILVEHSRPQSFFYITYAGNLPDRALAKYELVSEIFRKCGYTVGQYDPYHGQQVWKATLDSSG